MLSAFQIGGLLKILYVKNELRYNIDFLLECKKSIGIGLTYKLANRRRYVINNFCLSVTASAEHLRVERLNFLKATFLLAFVAKGF